VPRAPELAIRRLLGLQRHDSESLAIATGGFAGEQTPSHVPGETATGQRRQRERDREGEAHERERSRSRPRDDSGAAPAKDSGRREDRQAHRTATRDSERDAEQGGRAEDAHREELEQEGELCARRDDVDLGERADRDMLTDQFHDRGAVSFDDLLSPAALAVLKQYLLESTIWHDFDHIGGFVASYLEDGLACPLLLQIVDEIRAAFPNLLKAHPLSQAWAFKGLQPSAAIDAHADDAAVSVNFWVTPTAANRNPDHGGMVVCCVPPPPGWEVTDYHADRERVVTFLGQNAGNSLAVPYRENRAVLFKSRLFHYSDAPNFAPGYENHRISVTLLFGHHGSGRPTQR